MVPLGPLGSKLTGDLFPQEPPPPGSPAPGPETVRRERLRSLQNC